MKVFNEDLGEWMNEGSCEKIILDVCNGNIIEFGYGFRKHQSALFYVNGTVYAGDIERLRNYFVFSENAGIYIPIQSHTSADNIKGTGNFPYRFERRYEAIYNLDIFNGHQKIKQNPPKEYWAAKYLGNWTFGLEFETSCGYIPQEECFINGLIPLRDGSITGLEYTTVVLQGNRGLNLLHQQLEQLKQHCDFDKECSLHIHFGGYPVEPKSIFTLYRVALLFERAIKKYVPRLTFKTRLYKASRKDYCKELKYDFDTFDELYRAFACQRFYGSLYEPHPNDVEREQKWHVHTRYYWLNLINMLCYEGPKTVEFRLLRPSFDETKIIYWLLLLNSLLRYSSNLANMTDAEILNELEGFTLTKMINATFEKDDAKQMKLFLKDLKLGVSKQIGIDDYYGGHIELEDYSNLTI